MRLVLKAQPNSIMVRTLKPPLAIGADLPLGPAPFYEEPPDIDGSDFRGCLTHIESQLTHLMGLTPEEAAKTQSRTEGAKFAWRPALGACDASKARTTSISRAWRKTATWLADARRTKLEMRKREAWWKIMWYEHPKPLQVLATEPQKAAMQAFAEWRGKLTLGMLDHEPAATLLEEVAIKQAEREEAAAGKAATMKWVRWLHEGLAAGLGRQHKMSKVAQGWAPTATASGRANDMPSLEEEDVDEEDGLSPEQL